MNNNLKKFIEQYTAIQNQGWIKTHRPGPTGIGKTLEDLLGITENNIQGPDFGDYELKSSRLQSNCMLTLFTKSPSPAHSNEYLRNKFGYLDEQNHKILHSTLNTLKFVPIANTNKKLKIGLQDDKFVILSETGAEDIFWTKEMLQETVNKKFKNKLIYVIAESRGSGVNEEFRFLEAYQVNSIDYDTISQLITEGKIQIDIRIGQYKDGRVHDHGTAFRIKESDQFLLFKDKKRIA